MAGAVLAFTALPARLGQAVKAKGSGKADGHGWQGFGAWPRRPAVRRWPALWDSMRSIWWVRAVCATVVGLTLDVGADAKP